MDRAKKKIGQVSLEFLTTYGWAFLVVLIAIGALAYFGVLTPSKYTPKRCNFGPEITCSDFSMTRTAPNNLNIKFRLINSMGSSAIIPEIWFYSDGATQPSGWSWVKPTGASASQQIASGQYEWANGQGVDFEANIPNGIDSYTTGQKKKIKLQFKYYNPIQGASYVHTANGEIYDQVQ